MGNRKMSALLRMMCLGELGVRVVHSCPGRCWGSALTDVVFTLSSVIQVVADLGVQYVWCWRPGPSSKYPRQGVNRLKAQYKGPPVAGGACHRVRRAVG